VDAVARYVDDYPPRGGLRSFESLTFTTGGNAVNCSIALGRMGFAASVITKVGADASGDLVLSELVRYGVDTSAVIRSDDAHTPFSFVCVHRDGQRSFLHTVGTNGTLRLDEIDLDRVGQTDVCLVTGTMLMPRLDGAPTAALLRAARAAGAATVLDTSFVDSAPRAQWRSAVEPCLPHLDYFVPSRLEAEAITGHADPARAAGEILRGGCRHAVIKLDADGAYYQSATGSAGVVPAYRVPSVVDSTGAGDCWCAGFLAGLAQDLPLEEALRLGNAVATHCIQHPGASSGIPPIDEIRRFQQETAMG
jgi:sugar/nucleoside kinase (ribokinase family)